MINDKRLQVSADQAFTATAASTDSVDLGSDRDIGPGEPIWMVAACKVALAGTSPTLTVSIETDDNSAFSSPTTIASSRQYTALAAGELIVVALPFANERHLRGKGTLGGISPTVTLDIWFTNQDPRSWAAQPDGI